jgi:hypothetical protein
MDSCLQTFHSVLIHRPVLSESHVNGAARLSVLNESTGYIPQNSPGLNYPNASALTEQYMVVKRCLI